MRSGQATEGISLVLGVRGKKKYIYILVLLIDERGTMTL